MKALIASAYYYRLDTKQWQNHQPYPPLGTLLAASVARQHGCDVSLFDAGLNLPQDFHEQLLNAQPKLVVIYDDGFNYLTKMCLTIMRNAAFGMIRESVKAGAIVMVCSSDSSDQYELYLRQGASVVIRGEGEVTLKELLEAIERKESLRSIPGTAWIENGEVVEAAPRQVLRNLDDLPLPAWDLVNIEDYRKIWLKHHGYLSLNIATTRGCPYKCNWCAKPIYGNRYNSRSPQKVADEIELLLHKYQPNHFWMCDDIFGLKPGWVQSFKEEVTRRNLKFRYKIQSRVDLLTEAHVADLAASGAETVWVGAESGSQDILDAMDKGTTIEQIQQATQLLRKYGIRIAFFIQFGYLGETRSDIDKTVGMVLQLMPDEIGVSVSYPLPGTKFYEKVKADLREKQNWSDSDDLAMMFRNTYSPAFYRILHRYIHGRFRIQRGINQLRNLAARPFVPGWIVLRSLMSMVYHIPITLFRSLQLRQLQE